MNTPRLRVGTVAAAVLAFLPLLVHAAAARVDFGIGGAFTRVPNT